MLGTGRWRAGIDGIKEQGEIVSRGMGQLAQITSQGASQQAQIIGQNKRLEFEAKQAKRQENEQMFQNFVQAAELVGKFRDRQAANERQSKLDAQNAEKHEADMQRFKEENAAKLAAARGLIDDHNLTAKGEDFIHRNDGEDDLAYATRINSIKTLRKAKAEEGRVAAKNIFDQDIAKANLKIAQDELDLKEREVKAREQSNVIEGKKVVQKDYEQDVGRVNTAISNFSTAAQNAANPTAVYDAVNPVTRKNQEEGLKKAEQYASDTLKLGKLKHDLAKLFGKKAQKDGSYTNEDWQSVGEQIRNLKANDPKRIAVGRISVELTLLGRQLMRGQGAISNAESMLGAEAFGGRYIRNLTEFEQLTSDEQSGVVSKSLEMLSKQMTDTAGVIAFGNLMQEKELTAKNDLMKEITANKGLYAIPKEMRAKAFYDVVPEMERAQIPFEKYVKLSVEEQAKLAFGIRAKDMDFSEANRYDRLASNPSEAISELARTATVEIKTKGAEGENLRRKFKAEIQAISDKIIGPKVPSPGVPASVMNDSGGNYDLKAGDGGLTFSQDELGLPSYSGNPLCNSSTQSCKNKGGYIGSASKDGAAAPPRRKTNMSAFGGK